MITMERIFERLITYPPEIKIKVMEDFEKIIDKYDIKYKKWKSDNHIMDFYPEK